MFGKVLVANRGEIAVRVIRACRELGVRTVAVYSEVDRHALHVRLADEAYVLGPAPARESYLHIPRLVAVARRTGAEAVHPGYGFLSENPAFVTACREAGLTFIGPSAETMAALGDKLRARRLVRGAGIPIVPGTTEPVPDLDAAERAAVEVGYPVMLKAAAGGGGKGMRLVRERRELRSAFALARSEALSAFGNDLLYLERALERPRHVEVQILGDQHGHVIHLGERECSIQRRHQKLIEEAPSVVLTPEQRRRIGEAAVAVARAAHYEGAGTVEFLLTPDGEYYFLEVNARLQVEHPVTEQVTGVDLVKAQLAVAAGAPLPLTQAEVVLQGAAIECRISAEDPDADFLPCPGRVERLRLPEGPGVRNDAGMDAGADVPMHYDPLMAKLITWGQDRAEALARMARALGEYEISGVRTTIPFHRRVLAHPAFRAGAFDTSFIEREMGAATPPDGGLGDVALMAAAIYMSLRREGPAPAPGAAPAASPWRLEGREAQLDRWPR
ncbi:MAG: acetyl-CoA carboxylase biotin carboxylase subunit [Deltaproteobacteria bacterium]|nr:acetyl-CoA carboxylase biotin carboxylase subunit [Deltaproteobacteria bacterium]